MRIYVETYNNLSSSKSCEDARLGDYGNYLYVLSPLSISSAIYRHDRTPRAGQPTPHRKSAREVVCPLLLQVHSANHPHRQRRVRSYSENTAVATWREVQYQSVGEITSHLESRATVLICASDAGNSGFLRPCMKSRPDINSIYINLQSQAKLGPHVVEVLTTRQPQPHPIKRICLEWERGVNAAPQRAESHQQILWGAPS